MEFNNFCFTRIVQPLDYYRKFLENNIRPDGRNLLESRPVLLNVGTITSADGSSLLKIGNTTVICGIKAELTVPKPDQPNRGFIVPNVDLPPLCSPIFRPGPPSEQAQVSTTFVDKIIKCSECLNTESLCIIPGKWVWVLYCDLICLNYDGNILDACVNALMAALNNVRLPVVTQDEKTEQPLINSQETKHLQLLTQPVSTTFVLFDDSILLADPTHEEETLGNGICTIVTLDDSTICTVYKPGGRPLDIPYLDMCTKQALNSGMETRKLIEHTSQT